MSVRTLVVAVWLDVIAVHVCRWRAGASIIEQLVRCPPLRVRAWKLTSSSDRDVIRDTLLHVRQLAINNVVAMTTSDVIAVIFDEVSCLMTFTICTNLNLHKYANNILLAFVVRRRVVA